MWKGGECVHLLPIFKGLKYHGSNKVLTNCTKVKNTCNIFFLFSFTTGFFLKEQHDYI